ncbi:NAD(+) diphosphatase [Phytoactinopolyspora sp. XMNu-373]|uniref:NAD(+) diphosphatase n=1 Tax=Phytoactinopolyspora mesophila TaxID=2650750 RepID=A0A7K3MCQ7_9ACTN|nr:NAD(+) diphosphatase [Phytoactinopolyspora mesophila]NDL61034.1 NAD(+) diphosphatase [Phytoactinopolyspora mesophila]
MRSPLALSRSTADRAAHLRRDTEWLGKAWSDPATRVLVVDDGRVRVRGDALCFVGPGDAPDGERYLLGVDDDTVYLAVHAPGALGSSDDGGSGTTNPPAAAATLREAGTSLNDRDAGLAVHAIALANWHATHTHCPRCGHPTVVTEAGHVRRCPADGSDHYPRVDPAVIMLVVDENDRCLLGRQRGWPDGRYSTLAGFVEPGETPERAVVREVAEEVGITVNSCRYAGAQPWPFPSSLMLGYYATAAGDAPRPDGDEIEDARWFSRADLEAAWSSGEIRTPTPVSIASRLVEGWFGDTFPARASR